MKTTLLYCLFTYFISQGICIGLWGFFNEWSENNVNTWSLIVGISWLIIFFLRYKRILK